MDTTNAVPAIGQLSFVRTSPDGRLDFWPPASPGQWADDNAAGHRAAGELLAHMRITESPAALGAVVRGMVEKGVFGGAEVGFLCRIASATL